MVKGQDAITVTVEGKQTIADSSPSLCFAFAVLSFLFWGGILGKFGDNSSSVTLLLGCCQLGVYCVYHLSSALLLKAGQAWDGNLFMIFAGMFAGCGGLLNVTTGICGYLGLEVATQLPGVLWFLSGIMLFFLCPGVRKGPAAGFLFYIFGGVGLTIQGLCTLQLIPMDGFYQFAAWCFFIAGSLGLWVVVSTMYSYKGVNVTLGRPLFK